jgi:hypothetical protein
MSKQHKELCTLLTERDVEPWAVPHVRPAFDGDTEAALNLYRALSGHTRAAVAVMMWQAKVARDAFRIFLVSTWDHEHAHLIAAAGSHRRLAAMFRYAAFPPPDSLPERVIVWRGTTRAALETKAPAYSWTTCRDVACWFAMRGERAGVLPVLLRTEVARADIALFHEERDESEVMLLKWPASASIDGSPEDWRVGYERQEAWIRKCWQKAAPATV